MEERQSVSTEGPSSFCSRPTSLQRVYEAILDYLVPGELTPDCKDAPNQQKNHSADPQNYDK